jgi:hypothetical protein
LGGSCPKATVSWEKIVWSGFLRVVSYLLNVKY